MPWACPGHKGSSDGAQHRTRGWTELLGALELCREWRDLPPPASPCRNHLERGSSLCGPSRLVGAKVPLWGCQGTEPPWFYTSSIYNLHIFTFSHPSPPPGHCVGWMDHGWMTDGWIHG